MNAWRAALLAGVASLPAPLRAEVIALHDLLARADQALDVLMAETEHTIAQEDWNRARSEKGWRLSLAAGYGTERALIDEQRSRSFEATRTEVKLSYPLLGSYAKLKRGVEMAEGELAESRIGRDTAIKIAQLELEDVYAACWGAQEALEVIEAFLATEKHYGDPDDAPGYSKARAERRRLNRRRDDARNRLETLAGVQLAKLVALTVQLPRMPDLDVARLERDHPQLAGIRAQQHSARSQLASSVWYGIDGTFDITQTTIQDQSDGQAGNGLAATLNVGFPLTFYQAGAAERRKLEAESRALDLKLRGKRGEIIARAQETQAEHLDLLDEVEAVTTRVRAAGAALRRDGGAVAARRVRDYFTLALEEIDARTRFWRSHVEMRSYVPVGAAEPAPEPPGPSIADVGTRLAEPLTRLLRSN